VVSKIGLRIGRILEGGLATPRAQGKDSKQCKQ